MLSHLLLGRSALVRATAGPRETRPAYVARFFGGKTPAQNGSPARTAPQASGATNLRVVR